MKEEKKIIEIIANISEVEADDITPDDELRMIGINSLEIVELLVQLEEHFDILFDIFELNIETLTDVRSVIDITNNYLLKRE